MGKVFSIQSFSIGLALGVLLTGVWFLGNKSESARQGYVSTTTPPSVSQGIPAAHADTSGSLSVSNQPAGASVLVESVTVPPPGVWVAVREVTNGQLGNILGAARAKGPRSNIRVPLLRNTEPSHAYAVELYRDDGDGAFNTNTDSVYVDFSSGESVVAYFNTTA